MAGPWERYQSLETKTAPTGPWSKFSPEVKTAEIPKQTGRDPDVDYSGVPSAGFRSAFSFMDNDDEKKFYLDKRVGSGQWGQDPSGRYYIKPAGLARLGIKSDKPRSIEEPGITGYDVADVAGVAPAAAGAIGYGMAATGMGAIPGAAMAALGGGAGEAMKSLYKSQLPENLGGMGVPPQSASETAGNIGVEMLGAGTGELGFRAGRGIVKKVVGPGRKFMTPEKEALMDDAMKFGFRPSPASVTDQPLLGRFESLMKKIVGSPYDERNSKAALQGMDDILNQAGRGSDPTRAGVAIKGQLDHIKDVFDKTASGKYAAVDSLAGNQPIVPTAPIKKVLQDYVDKLPVAANGKKIFPSPELQRWVTKYQNLADMQTVTATQQMRTAFREAAETRDLPGISEHFAGQLKKATEKSFELAKSGDTPGLATVNKQAILALRQADSFYAQGIQKFDVGVVKALMRSAGETGSVDPEMVVKYLIKPGQITRVNQVKDLVSKQAWDNVKRVHAEDLTKNLISHTDDPLVKTFQGKPFIEALDKYGKDTLEAVYGKAWVDNAYKFGHSLMLVAKENKMTGGLVAASIALRPIQNIGKITLFSGLKNILASDAVSVPFLRYMTVGLNAPGTRAGTDAIARAAWMITTMAGEKATMQVGEQIAEDMK